MKRKIVFLAFFALLFVMFRPSMVSQEMNLTDFESAVRATTVTIYFTSYCDAFTVDYDKVTGFLYGTETGCVYGVPAFGIFPANVPKLGGKMIVLHVSDYGGSPTKRWLYLYDWDTGICNIYSYDGTGTPTFAASSYWYYSVGVGTSTGCSQNSQQFQ